MLLLIVRVLYAFVCAGAIATFISVESRTASTVVGEYPFLSFLGLLAITQVVTLGDILIGNKRIEVISAVYFGLLVGFLLSYLLLLALQPIIKEQPDAVRLCVGMMTTLILPYVCISLLMQTKDDFRFVIPYVEFSRELKSRMPMILDSSALIDGRIADLVETHIIDSQLIVPQFILHEVQDIADSNDKVRRTRGRRGLDILSRLQNNPKIDVRMYDSGPNEKGATVDQRLVDVAKILGARVVTNDFNLNKVASVQGIQVINLNDVSNALKPRYIPGERLQIKIIKEGEAQGQGVGYLDDGTMVVCEQTAHIIGKDIDAVVTSVLQSSAGRMIFARQVFQGHN